MIERFQGPSGRRPLSEALQRQWLVQGDVTLAQTLSDRIELLEYPPGSPLIVQGALDTELYFILAGTVSIVINGREMVTRQAGQHVGEMALIDVAATRAATVIAKDRVVAGRITEPLFADLADRCPTLWRRLAIELGSRLRQRNVHVKARNETPIVFIGSSAESLTVAQKIQQGLSHAPMIIRVWTDGVFGASTFPIEALEDQLQESDFGVLVLSPDDKVISRGKEFDSPRDNVVFELGLFIGALGRRRGFLVSPRGADVKIPTDLLGLTPIFYDSGMPGDLSGRLAHVCTEIARAVSKQGPK